MAQPVPPEDRNRLAPVDLLLEDRAVSPEERARILQQIEQVVEQGRSPVTPAAFRLKPRKTGILFPVLINLVAAALVAGGILALSFYFRSRKENLTLNRGTYQSVEGRLLETYQKQSESRFQEKEEQIRQARERFQAAENTLAARLEAREAELRLAMDRELAAERERLQAQGAAAPDIRNRLRDLEARRQAAYMAELGRYAKELELERLTMERDRERLFGDQIVGAYALVVQDLQNSDYLAARKRLQALKSLLADPSLAAIPGLQKRRAVDLALSAALTELVERKSRDAESASGIGETDAAVPERPAASAADSELADRLSKTEKELADSRRLLAEREQQLRNMQQELGARASEADSAQAKGARMAEELRQKNERLSAQLAAGAEKERELSQQVRAAEERALRRGHEQALKAVMVYLDYLSQSAAQKKETPAQLLAQARQDPLYAAVIREIQILATGAGLSGASAAGGYKLLGTVSSVGAGRVTVEPLVELNVKPGARVQIRRASDPESVQVIARGIVQQASGNKITVLLDSSAKGPLSPAVTDVVYVEAKSGD
jgi:hypothetical protein